MKMLSRSIALIGLFFLTFCKLPTIEPVTDCPNPPEPSFTLNKNACDIPCDLVATNKSKNAIGYEWYVDGAKVASNVSPFSITLNEQGPHSIELRTKNANDCERRKDTTIIVNNTSTFKKEFTLGTGDVSPIGISELSSGNFQILYLQLENLNSIIINKSGSIIGTVKLITDPISGSIATTHNLGNGEFLLSGTNGNNCRVVKINSSQSVASSPRLEFLFSASTRSNGAGGIGISSTEYVVSGFSTLAAGIYLGFAKISGNTPNPNKTIQRTETKNQRCISIAQVDASTLFVLCEDIVSGAAKIVEISTSGSYNISIAIPNLFSPKKLIALGGGKFAVLGKNSSNKWQLYYMTGRTVGSSPVNLSSFSNVQDMTTRSGDVLICGSDGTNLIVATLASGGSSPVYTTCAPSSASSILSASAITSTSSGGYIIAGQLRKDGKTSLYVVAGK